MTLGEKIIHLRKTNGLSQEDLAVTLGVSRQAVSKWETGEATPDTDKIIALAEYFAVTTDWLLRDIATPAADQSPHTGKIVPSLSPILLCAALCLCACGIFLMFYGRFVSTSTLPSTIGVILQICAIALAMCFGLYCKNSLTPEIGSHFIRTFWRFAIWMVALLPIRLILSFGAQFLNLIPQDTLFRLWSRLPQPLWQAGRMLIFAGIPLLCYLGVCLFVALWLCRDKGSQKK